MGSILQLLVVGMVLGIGVQVTETKAPSVYEGSQYETKWHSGESEAAEITPMCLDLFNAERLLQDRVMSSDENATKHLQIVRQLILLKEENIRLGCEEGKRMWWFSAKKKFHRPKRSSTEQDQTSCEEYWLGDGYCDLGCNTKEYGYDDGDCCRDTCFSRMRFYPCGYAGFQCLFRSKEIPRWFMKDVKFCHMWRPHRPKEGNDCGGSLGGVRCSPVGAMTPLFQDNTNTVSGSCLSTWKIQTGKGIPWWFSSHVKLCMKHAPDGPTKQCNLGQSPGEQCVPVNSWLQPYIDSTKNPDEACLVSWKLKTTKLRKMRRWYRNIRLCMFFYSENRQCGSRSSEQYRCAGFNQWTPFFRDSTHGLPGGCQMSWGILI